MRTGIFASGPIAFVILSSGSEMARGGGVYGALNRFVDSGGR